MAYRYGDRYQIKMFSQSLDEQVPKDHPVRVFDAIIEKIDLKGLGVEINPNKVGNSSYDPVAMIKLLVYGYSCKLFSSRKLERACYEFIPMKWLVGDLRPDHKTISEFRSNNIEALKKLFMEVSKIMLTLGLLKGDILYVDGSKLRANASIENFKSAEEYKKFLEVLRDGIENVFEKAEAIDKSEEDMPLLLGATGIEGVGIEKKVIEAQEKVKEIERKFINTTDPDCIKIKSNKGSFAGYNVQVVVDGEHGLIASHDVVSEHNDLNQFTEQIKKAEEVIGKRCKIGCADSGYFSMKVLKEAIEEGRRVIIPSPKQVNNKGVGEFSKDKFTYNAEEDCYICPEGNKLVYGHYDKKRGQHVYRFTSSKICRSCRHYGICTTAKRGRTVMRLEEEELMKKLEMEYLDSSSQRIYKSRKGKVEAPFGHIKHNLGFCSFLLRGIEKVRAELSIIAIGYNTIRAISILGVSKMVEMLMNI